MDQLRDSSATNGSCCESLAMKPGEGTSIFTTPGEKETELFGFDDETSLNFCCQLPEGIPEHLMEDGWDDMDLVQQDNSVAALEVKDLNRAFDPLFSLENVKDVDE